MHPERTTVTFDQDREVASCFRRPDDAERILLTGHRNVGGGVARDLKEDAGIRAAFVGWPVECRKRGPKPRHVATRLPSRTPRRMACKVRSCGSFMATEASIAKHRGLDQECGQ